jgi:hypothetical protein
MLVPAAPTRLTDRRIESIPRGRAPRRASTIFAHPVAVQPRTALGCKPIRLIVAGPPKRCPGVTTRSLFRCDGMDRGTVGPGGYHWINYSD